MERLGRSVNPVGIDAGIQAKDTLTRERPNLNSCNS
jgi:hypothetical protein